jgi:hypothetical protein
MMLALIYAGIRLIAGLTLGLSGRRTLHASPAIGGFLLAGLMGMLAVDLIPLPQGEISPFYPLIGFILVGAIGALLAIPLTSVFAFFCATAFGAFIGWIFGVFLTFQGSPRAMVEQMFTVNFTTQPEPIVLAAIIGIVVGVISIMFPELMTMVSTAFLGMAVVISTLVQLLAGALPLLQDAVLTIVLWVAISLICIFIQNMEK